MPQLSFFSAEANTPRVRDLAGLLCGPGQIVSFGGTAARLSVVVDEPWRVRAIVAACAERGVQAESGGSDEGARLVRTAFRADLSALAAAWTTGPAKSVPPGLVLDGALLRLWAMASGRWTDGGYLLGTDPGASGTGEPLGGALARCGLAATMLSDRGGGPGFRVSGQRRLNRLAELVGPVPVPAADGRWPVVSRVRATG
ncbi:MAG TPA: hypothetical protein VFV67_26980 [Actinophytocola sp.]|uniref:hypothetical protein n=1 Tax=Actinophytocola sp. TaxID=1872138 RepID=UPI002DBF144D|nr:hypothetical protein [Actinophytocola sp.]HEU5474309.1 hypothetical protein [Actinophytocola sp.]